MSEKLLKCTPQIRTFMYMASVVGKMYQRKLHSPTFFLLGTQTYALINVTAVIARRIFHESFSAGFPHFPGCSGQPPPVQLSSGSSFVTSREKILSSAVFPSCLPFHLTTCPPRNPPTATNVSSSKENFPVGSSYFPSFSLYIFLQLC